VKVPAAPIEAAVIAWLKVALIVAPAPVMGTFEANGRGVTDNTLGTLAATVLKVHT
jgi:hypothetical protein